MSIQEYKGDWKLALGMALFMAFYIFVTNWCESIIATIPRF